MKGFVPAYELVTPRSLDDALAVLAREPGEWKPFAGGTDLMVLLEAGKLAHKNYVNIWNLKELRGIEVTGDQVSIGALSTYTEIQAHAVLRKEFPMLCQAASETGGLAIQNRGTLGGNIVNASPAADSPPALLVYDAELELVSTQGVRRVPYHSFYTGYKQMIIRADEMLSRVFLPRTGDDLRHHYRKVGTRKAQAISKICFAATARTNGDRLEDVRLAFGSVAPLPIRCMKTEAALRGKPLADLPAEGRRRLAEEISPINDMRSTADYRLAVSLNLLEQFLSSL
ncbi:MAG: xanthine dehydrogenase family protein subunit M [Acidobacteriota bacterium]